MGHKQFISVRRLGLALALFVGLVAVAWSLYKWSGQQAERLGLDSRLQAATLSARALGEPTFSVHLAAYEAKSGLDPVTVPRSHEVLFIHPDPVITDVDIAAAQVSQDHSGMPALRLEFKRDSARRIQAFSRQHIGERLVFLASDKVLIAPVIASPITENFTLIEGSDLTDAEIRQWAVRLSRR